MFYAFWRQCCLGDHFRKPRLLLKNYTFLIATRTRYAYDTPVTLFAAIARKAKGVLKMKKDIHPNYQKCVVTCISCGATFETGSTLKEIKVDTCSNCHPFYTGKQRFVQADGRIDRFNKKLEKAQQNRK